MNAPVKQPPASEAATASPGVTILIHFGLFPNYSRMLDIHRIGQFMILARGLENTLRASGLLVEGTEGGCGALSEGILVFNTPERNRAIAVVKDFLDSCGLLGPCIEIAWLCQAEGILRTCWPVGPVPPFDRHLEDAVVEMRRLIVKVGFTQEGRET